MLADMPDKSIAKMGQEVTSGIDCLWLAARDTTIGARQAKSNYYEDGKIDHHFIKVLVRSRRALFAGGIGASQNGVWRGLLISVSTT